MITPAGTIPTPLRAGDSWSWSLSDPAYPGPGWTLALVLVSGSARHTLTGAWGGSVHVFAILAEDSAAIGADTYHAVLVATHSDLRRVTIASGLVQILPDPLTAPLASLTSHARRMLAAIEATLEGRASDGELDLLRHQMGDRSSEWDPPTLIKLRNQYAAYVAAEDAAQRVAQGDSFGRMIQTRFRG